ncbi:MAG: hypothetical protein AAF364_16750 [Pseudomonadota bacterium]|jgi:hypothetical protein|uniref:hypothetical protein n=1 Tax=unclassified Alteromonas TaxID=2614992 RepID=UPI0019228BFE|nr:MULTISPECIES: hypothetical protein [unclassified Alteromonas]WDT85115.1 hypothetical protein OZ660_14380 [Alteromonas sp. 009811495]BCO20025.1 hypothetical protein KUC3_28820 [Alteromonas sp. KC3]BCO23990.1 hypothetical protein KUC14_28590 [Alteromonas sp. KC14]
MAKTLEDFLVELDTNSELLEAYKKDPVATATKYGLSEEDVQLFKDKNWEEIEKRFTDENKAPRVVHY